MKHRMSVVVGLALVPASLAWADVQPVLTEQRCSEGQCRLVWQYEGQWQASGQSLLSLYQEAERYGNGAVQIREDLASRTLIVTVDQLHPTQVQQRSSAPVSCATRSCEH
ncbi:hypothetical protein SAMN04488540_10714 [Ferrimonas sediminum]|uniref:Uncharacterized protein n=1 Tax=Ferrimonas sediminum TaxID=718193 RepID=A0A1G8SU75_9GAMM|nr:hypothetical protein [Ferrimonas sediminum]SDJ32769.1 hypothetical protein SAMN04488540_10714 [Ferrimonas sediminum]